MRKITSFLMLCLMFLGISVNAQTTFPNNSTVYTIDSEKRGYLLYNPGVSTTNIQSTWASCNGVESTSHPKAEASVANNQFAFIKAEGRTKYFMYSVGAQKFLKQNGLNITLTEFPEDSVTLTATGDFFAISFSSGDEINLTNWDGNAHGIRVANSTYDGGNRMTINVASTEADLTEAIARSNRSFISDIDLISNQKAYVILNVRTANTGLHYDGAHPNEISWNGKDGYKNIAFGYGSKAYQWAIYKSESGKYYFYSLGGQKFIGTTEGGNAAIPLTANITNSIVLEKISDNTNYPFLISCNNKTGAINTNPSDWYPSSVINWKDGYSHTEDPGNQFAIYEVANLDEEVFKTIDAAVKEYDKVPITSLSQLSNGKTYAARLSRNNTAWSVNDEGLKTAHEKNEDVNITNPLQQFAFITYDETTYYLYSVGKSKFINKEGGLSEDPTDPISFITNDDGTFVLKFDDTHYINENNEGKLVVNDWNEADEGNKVTFYPANDFNPETPLIAIAKPKEGKAYTFTNIRKDEGTANVVLYMDNDGLKIGAADKTAADYGNQAIFIARKVNDKYVFVNGETGKYLVWKGSGSNADGKGENGNIGYTENYTEKCGEFILTPDTEGLITFTFGVSDRSSSNSKDGNIIITFNNSNYTFNQNDNTKPFRKNEHSSYFKFTEVPYANNVTLIAISESDELINGIEIGKTIGTFSAPFPFILPEGVTAYYAHGTENDGAKLTAVATGNAIPANQGIIVIGENDVTAACMVPATTETSADLSSNAFGNSAGADYTIAANDYVLAKRGQGIGFYPATEGSTLKMNKAYLNVVSNDGTQSFRLSFNDIVDNIEETPIREMKDSPIYDLSGRRVTKTVKGGIYIQGGRKFIVK